MHICQVSEIFAAETKNTSKVKTAKTKQKAKRALVMMALGISGLGGTFEL